MYLIVIEFMFLGINIFWALLRLNESESGPKHIYAQEHKLYCYIKMSVLVKGLEISNKKL